MNWMSLLTAGVLAAAGVFFALVPDRETPAKAALDAVSVPITPAGEIPLRSGDAPALSTVPAYATRTVTVRRGDTLMRLLTRNGVDRQTAHAAIAELAEIYDVGRLRIGQELSLTFQNNTDHDKTGDTLFLGLTLSPNAGREVAVRMAAGRGFVAEEIERVLERSDAYAAATIETSLYEAALDAGMPIEVLVALVRVFSFDIDFQRDIQPGDSVEVMYDRFDDALGNLVRNGEIRFAAMTLSGKRLAFYRHTPESGVADYFDTQGRSVRKTLMRTPVDGARLSSGYGKRKHPILGYTRMHRGVDFAAPRGTPIMAAGDGVVEQVGRNGAYGKYLRIRHNATLKTAYAHLHNYARGLKLGTRVRQGETIGYVGSTGRSTGPHLHYEVLVNGRQKNPMSVKLPAGEKLKGRDLKNLQARIPELAHRLTLARERTRLAGR